MNDTQSTVISPTVGRKVWFRPADDDRELRGLSIDSLKPRDEQQAMDATVVYAFGDRLVNLVVYDHYGNRHIRQGVTLVQPMDTPPAYEAHCFWMPFQVGQAKAQAQ